MINGCASTADVATKRLKLVQGTSGAVAVSKDIHGLAKITGQPPPDECCEEMNKCEKLMQDQCVRAFEETTADYTTAQITTVVVTVVGTAAGAVGVPALTSASAAGNAVWISALGGISGAANALNLSQRQVGLSADKIYKNRTDFLADYRPLIDEYNDKRASGDVVKACSALRKVRSRCVDYLYTLTPSEAASDITK